MADLPHRIRALTELLEDRYRYEDVPVAAKPVPVTEPVMWMLGTNTKSAGYAAEFGTGYVFGQFMSDTDGAEVLRSYREGFQPSARLREPHTMVAVSIVCAETEERAGELAAEASGFGQRPLPSDRLDTGAAAPEQSSASTRIGQAEFYGSADRDKGGAAAEIRSTTEIRQANPSKEVRIRLLPGRQALVNLLSVRLQVCTSGFGIWQSSMNVTSS